MDFQNVIEEEKRQILKELGDNPTDVDIKYVSYIRKIPVKQIEQWYEEIKSIDLSIDLQVNECYIIGNKKPKGMKSIKIKTEFNNASINNKQSNMQETKILEKNDNKINQENVKIPFQIAQPIDTISDNQNKDKQKQNSINEIQQNENLVVISENNNEVNQQNQQQNEINQKQQNEKCLIKINDKLNNNNLTTQNLNTNDSIKNQNQVEQIEPYQNNKYICQQKSHNEINEQIDSLKEASSLGIQSIKQNNQQQNKSIDYVNQSLENKSNIHLQRQAIQQFQKKKNKVQQKQNQKNLNILSLYSDSGFKDKSENQSSVKSQQIQKSIDNLSIQDQNDNKSVGIELQPISISNSPSQKKQQKQQNNDQQQNQNAQQIKQLNQQIDLTNEEKPQQVFPNTPQQQFLYQNFQQLKNVPLSVYNQNTPQLAIHPNYQEQYQPYQQIMQDYNQLNSINQQFMIMNNFFIQQAQIQNVLLQKLEQVITLIKDKTKKQ